jgi:hypothetical protein
LNIIDFHPQKRARVHFIPDLKVGVFVTLRAPDVIKRIVQKKGKMRCFA